MRTERIVVTGLLSIFAVAIMASVALARNPSVLPATPPVPDTGFTYQGFVRDGEQAASGAYDFEFALFNASSSGVQVGVTESRPDLAVVDGLVSTRLDFGAGIFDGSERWLETRTRRGNQTGAFETLTPRHQISPVPYATYAFNGPFWMLGGNAGTTPGSEFVGTTDAQPLVFKTNNSEAMRISPTGNIGIGRPNPNNKLEVAGRISIRETDDAVLQMVANQGSGSYIQWVEKDVDQRGVLGFAKGSPDLVYQAQSSNINTGSGNEVFRITSDGEVGIGEDEPCDGDPNCLLHVSKSGTNRVKIQASSDQQAGLDLRSGSSSMIFTYDTGSGVKFWNDDRGVNDMFIRNSDGFIGMSAIDPSAPLHLRGENAGGYGAILANTSPTGQGVLIQGSDGSGSQTILQVQDRDQNAKFVVREDGNVGIGRSNPNNKLEVGGRISIRETDDAVLQMVANQGSGSYIQWVEKDVDQRGVLGFAKGSPDLVYQAQSSNISTGSGNEVFRITSDGEVGIGINNPSEKLAVAGVIQSTTGGFKFPDGSVQTTAASGAGGEHVCTISGNNCDFGARSVITDGRIGIGTDSFSARLEIQSTFGGGLRSAIKSGNGGAGTFTIDDTNGSGHALLASTSGTGRAGEITIQNPSNPNAALYLSTTGTGKALHVSGKSQFDGDVAIGDGFTNHQLTVNGSIKTREVVVSTSDFPDYVFDDDYELMGLSDLEQTIRQEGHLPGIPSAAEVAVSGMGLGDMQTRLLEKIEELTLYTIEQEKEIDALRLQFAEISGVSGAEFGPINMNARTTWALLGALTVIVIFFGIRRFITTATPHS